jgi:hypothetical protein
MTIPDPPFTSSNPVNRSSEPIADQHRSLRSRRRRRGQLVLPKDAQGRAALIASLTHRAYPTYELFVYSLLCGAILGLGYVLDSQALLLFGILVAPLLSPWVGLLLATVTGSLRFFFETLMALLVSALLVFMIGGLAGLAARPFMPRTFNEAFAHTQLWWPDLVVLAIGAIILTISFIRSEAKPFLPSVMLAYGFFLPLSAAGFGLGSGIPGLWPNGLLVFFVYFAWASMFGLLTLVAMRFLPSTLQGFLLSALVAIVLLATLVLLMGGDGPTASFALQPPGATQTAVPVVSPSPTIHANLPPVSPAGSETPVVAPATATAAVHPTPVPLTLEVTLPPTSSPTVTLTIEPTPVYARVHVGRGGGAVLRETAGGKGITVLDNYSIVQVLPETQDVAGTTWAHVIAVQGGNRLTGWIVQLYLDVATPAPNWVPSATAVLTATP